MCACLHKCRCFANKYVNLRRALLWRACRCLQYIHVWHEWTILYDGSHAFVVQHGAALKLAILGECIAGANIDFMLAISHSFYSF